MVEPFLPVINLLVEYPQDLVYRGNFFTPSEVRISFCLILMLFQASVKPSVTFKAEAESLWTLMLVDPGIFKFSSLCVRLRAYLCWLDFTGEPGTQLLHWLVYADGRA